MAQRETKRSLWDAARGLSANQHRVLRLRYAEDMSIKEIAQVVGKSQVSVKVLLCRARTHLARKLENVAPEAEGIALKVAWLRVLLRRASALIRW